MLGTTIDRTLATPYDLNSGSGSTTSQLAKADAASCVCAVVANIANIANITVVAVMGYSRV